MATAQVTKEQLTLDFTATVRKPEPSTVEQAVVEEPEPSYLRDRRVAEREAHERGTTISERKAWAAEAAMSRQRIVAKYKS